MGTTNILDLNNRVSELEKNSGGGGSTLVAGDYIEISNGVINVTKEIGDNANYKYELTSISEPGSINLEVKKYVNDVLTSTTTIPNDGETHNIDDVMTIQYVYGPYVWSLTLLVDSTEQAAGYNVTWGYQDSDPRVFNFVLPVDPDTTLATLGDLKDLEAKLTALINN